MADDEQQRKREERKESEGASIDTDKHDLLEMQIQGISPIEDLIENANVSKEQKDSWRSILSLDIPKGSRIKIETGVTGPEIAKAQSDATNELKAHGEENIPKYLYMFDNCYSGSVLNDGLMDSKSTVAVLASSASDQVSIQDNETDRGKFMQEVLTFVKQGASIGEAFIRADMALNNGSLITYVPSRGEAQKGQKGQNPQAIFRKEDEIIKVSSIENMPPVFEDSVKRLG